MAENNTIAVDFDGVIHKYSKGWHDGSIYDDPVDGAMESLIFMKNCGYRIVVFTAREDTIGVHNWIRDNLPLCRVDEVTNRKPLALVYIDDKGIRFTDWKSTLRNLQELTSVQKRRICG